MRPTETDLPDKRYFRIGEVSAITGLKAYVLRYWQTEFSQINPVRSRAGQRLYRKADIDTVLEVKRLLYEKGLTIAGAKQHLRQRHKKPGSAEDKGPQILRELRAELMGIRDLLKER